MDILIRKKRGGSQDRIRRRHLMKIFGKTRLAEQIFWELLGSACIAAGICNFAVQARFPMSGFSGIAILLYRLLGLPVGLSTILLNLPVGLLCFRLLGRHFFLGSMRCMLLSSLMIDYIAPLFPVYTGSRLLAALCTGVFCGLGFAVIYTRSSSTGGMDFIVMAVKKKFPHLSVGRIIFFADMSIVAAGGILLRDMDGILYGIIVAFLTSAVVDKLMYGVNAGKMALIITDCGRRLCEVIDQACQRGTTLLQASGGYHGDERQIVLCACSNKEMYQVLRTVKEADPRAFIVVMESSEVHGEGFRFVQIG